MHSSPPHPALRSRLRRATTVLLAALAAACTGAAFAQSSPSYPSKSIRLIVPFGPGTAPDVLARVTADGLQRRIGQTVVVENRAGAGGKLGTEVAAAAAPDGYTLFLGTKDSQSILTHLHPTWSIKPDRALTPVVGLARIENVLVTRPGGKVASLPELLSQAKGRELSYGSPGVGTNLHLMVELLQARQGLKLMHVPYSRSFAEALPAVVRGELDLLIAGVPPMLPFLKDGKLKGLAVSGTARSRYLPDVPTFAELGIRDLETGGWFGAFVPVGTPAPVAAKLNAELTEVVKSAEFRSRLETIAADPWPIAPAELATLIDAEKNRWGKLIQDSHISLN